MRSEGMSRSGTDWSGPTPDSELQGEDWRENPSLKHLTLILCILFLIKYYRNDPNVVEFFKRRQGLCLEMRCNLCCNNNCAVCRSTSRLTLIVSGRQRFTLYYFVFCASLRHYTLCFKAVRALTLYIYDQTMNKNAIQVVRNLCSPSYDDTSCRLRGKPYLPYAVRDTH